MKYAFHEMKTTVGGKQFSDTLLKHLTCIKTCSDSFVINISSSSLDTNAEMKLKKIHFKVFVRYENYYFYTTDEFFSFHLATRVNVRNQCDRRNYKIK